VFLGEAVEERRRWIGASPTEHGSIKQHLHFEIDCRIHPRPLTINPDSGLVDRNPRRRRRRWDADAVSQPMHLTPDYFM